MKHVNWFWVATGLFVLSALLFTVAPAIVGAAETYVVASGVGLLSAGWVCDGIGIVTRFLGC